MRRFEFNEGSSCKFWEVEQDVCTVNVRYGRIGTAGQTQSKVHADAGQADAALRKLVREKIAKGYVENNTGVSVVQAATAPAAAPVAGAEPSTRPFAVPAAVQAAPEVEVKAATSDVAPWLANGPVFEPPARMHALAWPSRRFPAKLPVRAAATSWDLFIDKARARCRLNVAQSDSAYQDAIGEAATRVKEGLPEGSLESDAVLLAMELCYQDDLKVADGSPFIDFLVASKGLPYALDVLLQLARTGYNSKFDFRERTYMLTWGRQAVMPLSRHINDQFSAVELALRGYLSVADDATWQRCATAIEQAAPGIAPARRATLALLLPELPAFSDQLVLDLKGKQDIEWMSWLLLTARAPDAVALLREQTPTEHHTIFYSEKAAVATALLEHGQEAVAILENGACIEAAAKALACIGTPASMTALARARTASKDAAARLAEAAFRWPLAAIAALSEMIAAGGDDAAALNVLLSSLLRVRGDAVATFAGWISPEAMQVLRELQAGSAPAVAIADADELPSVLATPPWLRKQNKAPVALNLAPLPLAPSEHWLPGERERYLHTARDLASDKDRSWDDLAGGLVYSSEPFRTEIGEALAAGDVNHLLMVMTRYAERQQSYFLQARNIVALPAKFALPLWTAQAQFQMYDTGFGVAYFGLDGVAALAALCERRPTDGLQHALHFGACELAAPAARALFKLKTARPVARRWLLTYPEYAVCALIAPALGKPGTPRDAAATALRMLAMEGHADLLMAVAARYQNAEVIDALRAMLDEDPLNRFPAKIPPAPGFYQPLAWSRPVLRESGHALPDAALEHLGAMLRFSTADGLYAGLAYVKAACTPRSLADFAWDLFNAWLEATAPSKEDWAFKTLGVFGDDDTARRLTPYLRAWPGEAQHARAVAGLDVLAQIGTDTALMLLNGIAQKVKFKGLQDRAVEKIAEIAEARDLTPEELEDRLAPDLGLDQNGLLELDFGPRQFVVGFDEALKPYVRDSDGARLPDLPKPKKTDDAAFAGAAVERFKLLKKDARTIAAQQVLRLETAMCAQRRWTGETFRTFLAEHPLVRHLVQRLVWGAYDAGSGAAQLLACFRVAPDGAYTDANDDAYTLPDGDDVRIGIPHALDLPAADSAAFGQLFADYELLQPFQQIGRDTYALTDAEQSGEQLARWKGTVVPTGRVLGLTNKGWRRGAAQDGGGIWYFNKALADGRVIELNLDPGIIVGMVDEYPDQTLGDIIVGVPSNWGEVETKASLSSLDPIAASELIRDMEALRA